MSNPMSEGEGKAFVAPFPSEGTSPHTDPQDVFAAEGGASFNLAPREVDFLPPFLQSLVTLFRLHGKRVSGSSLLAALGNSAPSISACQRSARSLGLDSKLVHRAVIKEINHMVFPCVLLLSNNRCCVLTARNGEKVEVVFPENGNDAIEVYIEDLQEDYTGYALFASLEAAADDRLKSMAQVSPQRWFWDVVMHYKPMYRQVVLISVVVNLMALIPPLFMMNVYDRVVPNVALETLWVLALGAFIGYIFEVLLRMMRSIFVDRSSRNIDTILATRLMQQILGMRMEDRPLSSGALINHMREFESMREFFSASTMLTLVDLPFMLFFLLIVAGLGGILVVIPIVAVAILLITVYMMQKAIHRHAMVNYQGNMEKNAHLVEMVSGMEAIKMAAAENRMLQIWEKVVGHSAENGEKSKTISAFSMNFSMFMTHTVSLAVIIWGVYLIADRQLTTGGLIACNILTGKAMSSVVQLASLMTRYQQAKIALTTLNNLMALPQEHHDAPNVDFGHMPHSLELVQVDFSYTGAHLPTLSNINVVIQPGEKVGIIGNMGSGKSTLSRLLVGLYEPSQGAIKFGGVDLRQLDLAELRTRIGYVPQEPVLFHGSVRDNIALGAPYIKDQLILRAAWLAGVTDFVRMNPAGFAMQVGERGSSLSGGQRQAVALARALLHDPDVLILDEPTSNIDGFTEAIIKRRLKEVLEHKTLIINMHQTGLMELVDRVLVLSNGRVVLDGPKLQVFQQLRQNSGQSA